MDGRTVGDQAANVLKVQSRKKERNRKGRSTHTLTHTHTNKRGNQSQSQRRRCRRVLLYNEPLGGYEREEGKRKNFITTTTTNTGAIATHTLRACAC